MFSGSVDCDTVCCGGAVWGWGASGRDVEV